MKTITTREHDLIIALIGEGRTTLAEAILEKDLLITEVLGIFSSIQDHDVGLVFCGGTCLSKAHGLIERMSEDIDFKLVLPKELSRNTRSRQLSAFKKHLASVFEQAGFGVPAGEIIASNENSYISLNLHYKSHFAPIASLRPEIKVELNARPPLLPAASLPIGSMLCALAGERETQLQMQCVGVLETLAEKVLSFLRRTAQARVGRNRGDYDDRLVRHLYDVSAIARSCKTLVFPHEHFAAMVAGDAAQFRYQHPEFEQDPAGQMRLALQALQHDPGAFEHDYSRFVNDLVFGEFVSFDEARAIFIELADQLL